MDLLQRNSGYSNWKLDADLEDIKILARVLIVLCFSLRENKYIYVCVKIFTYNVYDSIIVLYYIIGYVFKRKQCSPVFVLRSMVVSSLLILYLTGIYYLVRLKKNTTLTKLKFNSPLPIHPLLDGFGWLPNPPPPPFPPPNKGIFSPLPQLPPTLFISPNINIVEALI